MSSRWFESVREASDTWRMKYGARKKYKTKNYITVYKFKMIRISKWSFEQLRKRDLLLNFGQKNLFKSIAWSWIAKKKVSIGREMSHVCPERSTNCTKDSKIGKSDTRDKVHNSKHKNGHEEFCYIIFFRCWAKDCYFLKIPTRCINQRTENC